MMLRDLGFLLAATAVVFACGDGDGGATLAGGYPTNEDPHDEESGAYPAPNDDPTIGQVEDAGASPATASPTDGGADAGAAAPARVESPVPGKVVTYAYGVKNSRYAAGYHTGDDYAAAVGLPVVAVRNGKIAWSNDNGGAYGTWMGLEADNGRTYVYCHLSSRLVSAGTVVTAGQTLGKVGATGNVTGPHLHFEDHPKGPFVYAQVRKPAW